MAKNAFDLGDPRRPFQNFLPAVERELRSGANAFRSGFDDGPWYNVPLGAFQMAASPYEGFMNAFVDQPAADVVSQASGIDRGKALGGVQATRYGMEMLAPLMQAKSLGEIGRLARARMGERGIIGGPKAKTADVGKLKAAQAMKAEGRSADEIFDATGWWLDHPDGVPRFEISDHAASYDPSNLNLWDPDMGGVGTVGNAVSHDDLYRAYPNVGDVEFRHKMNTPGGVRGAYSPRAAGQTERIATYPSPNRKSVALHEIQHAIQERENMGRGATPRMMSDEANKVKERFGTYAAADDIIRTHQQTGESITEIIPQYEAIGYEIDDVVKLLAEQGIRSPKVAASVRKGRTMMHDELMKYTDGGVVPKSGETLYRRVAGEADARMVQRRMNMTPDERKANAFYKDYDVPPDQQIVRREPGNSFAIGYHGSPPR